MASEAKGNSKFAVSTSGDARKGAKQWQEDSFFSFRSATGAVFVAGIFDGHGGYNGLLASATAKAVSEAFLDKHKEECENWSVEVWCKQFEELFEHIHETIREKFVNDKSTEDMSRTTGKRYIDDKGIVRSSNGDPIHGGSTGSVVAVLHPGTADAVAVSANVGDSTAVLVTADGKYEFLTEDHGPENQTEFLRVKDLPENLHPEKLLYVYDKANVFRKYECPRVFLEDGTKDPVFVQNPWGNGLHPTNVRYEPAVYAVTPRQVSRDTTCIAMTRALGDFYAHQFGLTFKPTITVLKIPQNVSFIVAVASDGIWDCWRYEDFSSYLATRSHCAVGDIVQQTLNESIQRAIANFGAKHYDDASLVCVHYSFAP